MAKGHIKVSVSDLQEIGSQLARLKSEFEDASNIVGDFSSAMGAPSVNDSLHTFATNWSIHRKSLCSSIEGLGKTAETAAKLYDGVDSHLASALEKATTQTSGG